MARPVQLRPTTPFLTASCNDLGAEWLSTCRPKRGGETSDFGANRTVLEVSEISDQAAFCQHPREHDAWQLGNVKDFQPLSVRVAARH